MIGIKKAAEELNMNSETLGHWLKLETNPLSCNQCGHKVARISKLRKHEKTHLATDPNKESQLKFSCDECSKTFARNDGLKKHKQKHQSEEHHVKEFRHSRIEEKENGGQVEGQYHFPCYLCSKNFQYEQTMKRHEIKHSEFKIKNVHKSEVNAAKDGSFNAINFDLITDDEEYNFVGNENSEKCEILSEEPEFEEQADAIGINIDLFDPHELINTDPAIKHKSTKGATFICSYCGLASKRKDSLEYHMKAKHRDGIMLHCSHCGLVFKRKDSLEDHMKAKHRDGIMLQCTPCEKEFASKNALKKHVESKHEGRRYKCQHCAHKATQQINLKTHIRKKHNLDILMSIK